MQKAVEYIKQNWKEGRSLKEIAKIHKVDPGNLEREFRSKEGITVKHFTDNMKREFLQKLISEDHRYGYEMGLKLGFKNDRAFYRWVKHAFGCSFRELIKKERK
ncbi:MAG: helix-turn-helix transcriptional regulator [Ignavibacteriales bacterium]|nr:helix-turn-helix transcriptional regulator [Ignavibacteriales bacterium]